MAKEKKDKIIRFKKICKGLYMNHDWDFVISRQVVWRKSEGRKWEASWYESYLGMDRTKRTSQFDTMKEARDFLRDKAGSYRYR